MDVKGIIILSQVDRIGPAFFKKNRGQLMLTDDYVSFIKEKKPSSIELLPQYEQIAEKILEDCRKLDITIISCFMEQYPQQLLEINRPPQLLYLKGNMTLLQKNIMAIIGTRHSTQLGNKIAEKLGIYFSRDFAICNGLAEGIDVHSIYHKGQVNQNVIGIVSGGLNYDETCTKAHAKTIGDVLRAGGLVISEHPPQQPEDQFSGSNSSRIQAGLSDGLILVQSSLTGGSKYALAAFAKLKRTLGVINFPNSKEFMEDSFEANRVICSELNSGVSRITERKEKDVILTSITPIEGKDDYENFAKKVIQQRKNQNLLF